MAHFTVTELTELAERVLRRAGASDAAADTTARALVYAELCGLPSHGLARLPMYLEHARHQRVDLRAEPRLAAGRDAALLVDAADGLAYPACQLAIDIAIERARRHGTAVAGITRSHHFGMAAYHLEAVAEAGMVGLAFSNSPAAIPAWQGRRALFGTNPIGAVFPRASGRPLLIDMSLSEVARGKIMIAAKEGKPIPPNWALDADGQPTIDAKAALAGMMLPFGGVKGAMLALMVELLCVALTGSQFGFEADSFFEGAGNRPCLGQLFWLIDPGALAGNAAYAQRVEDLIDAMQLDDAVRLPGARRDKLRADAQQQGITLPDGLAGQLRDLAGDDAA
ncbi:MAG: Ldh family oxidoreductase [Burkholderiales bacterium]|nr:Ldh family oxidoreductase [Burkholderiales bacterium]